MRDDRPLLHLHDALLVTPGASAPPRFPAHPALAPWCRLVEDGRRVLIEHGGTVVTLEGRAATVCSRGCCRCSTARGPPTRCSTTLGHARRGRPCRTPCRCSPSRATAHRRPARAVGRWRRGRGRDLRRLRHGPLDAGAAGETLASAHVAILGSGATAPRSSVGSPGGAASGAWSAVPSAPSRPTTPSSSAHPSRARARHARPSSTTWRSPGERPWLQVLPYRRALRGRRPALPPGCLGLPHVLASRAAPRARASRTTSSSSTARPRTRPRRAPLAALGAALAAMLVAAMARDRRSCAAWALLRARGPLGRHAALRPGAARAAVPLVRAGASGGPLPLVRVRMSALRRRAFGRGARAAGGSRLAACGDRHRARLGDVHDRRVDAPELRRPSSPRPSDTLGARRGRLGQRRASRTGPRAGRGDRRGARALLGALRPARRLRVATARELGASAVDPARFALFHPAQLAMPGFPCAPFTGRRGPRSSKARSLADGTRAFLPAELVYLARPEPSLRPIGVLDQQRPRVRTDLGSRRRWRPRSSWSSATP